MILNDSQTENDLLSQLEKGRYLIENRNSTSKSFIFIWIFNESSLFKHLKYKSKSDASKPIDFTLDFETNIENQIHLKPNRLKKIMYMFSEDKQKMREYRNDFHTTWLEVSNSQFEFILRNLIDSTAQLSKGLKRLNEFLIAFV